MKDFNWSEIDYEPQLVYHGLVAAKNNPDDYFILVKSNHYCKFIHGFDNSSELPLVEFVQKLKHLTIPRGLDVSFEYENETYSTLPGDVTIYKLKNGDLLWEY